MNGERRPIHGSLSQAKPLRLIEGGSEINAELAEVVRLLAGVHVKDITEEEIRELHASRALLHRVEKAIADELKSEVARMRAPSISVFKKGKR